MQAHTFFALKPGTQVIDSQFGYSTVVRFESDTVILRTDEDRSEFSRHYTDGPRLKLRIQMPTTAKSLAIIEFDRWIKEFKTQLQTAVVNEEGRSVGSQAQLVTDVVCAENCHLNLRNQFVQADARIL